MSSASDREIEVKFYLPEFEGLFSRLEALHASLQVPRTHEFNLRYSNPLPGASSAPTAPRHAYPDDLQRP
jgi:hypothetical protein